MNLEKQHVVVMGGSSGIGLGVARACLESGASLTLVGRSPQKLADAAAGLGAAHRVRTFAADVTDEAQVRRLFEEHPPAHHVVLTAVHGHYQPIRQMELSEARLTIDSKLVAALHVAKHARLEPNGSLVFTTGIAADRPGPGGSVIAAVNGALVSLVRALALELAPVRVNAVSPGWIDTPIWDTLAGNAKQQRFEQHARRLPVGRVGVPADIAHAVLFLMGNGYTTGEVLNVDGGHRLV
ncbi:SDR family oxidoreductase [Vitiosangium sp. GDMCC 1.1324]|uniref:SDR family oxidoreductase n=1 Tax=Vitiosangium sp. (strain GDMCC 1.1324) TaxID=2138576 RepID=UPI000D3CFF87|nr:SDR family oxidoreductase [Vitiosangium sp. GDMCC 1.1324]PTL78313.1 short chain dehydrogenase [Vitiosangium sp. GDMCC 1.1324]